MAKVVLEEYVDEMGVRSCAEIIPSDLRLYKASDRSN